MEKKNKTRQLNSEHYTCHIAELIFFFELVKNEENTEMYVSVAYSKEIIDSPIFISFQLHIRRWLREGQPGKKHSCMITRVVHRSSVDYYSNRVEIQKGVY